MSEIDERYAAAEAAKDQGDIEGAVEQLKAIVADDPNHVLTRLALAKLLIQTGDAEQAVAHAQKACEIEPTEWFNFTALSMTYQKAWAATNDRRYIQLAEEAMAQSRMLEQ